MLEKAKCSIHFCLFLCCFNTSLWQISKIGKEGNLEISQHFIKEISFHRVNLWCFVSSFQKIPFSSHLEDGMRCQTTRQMSLKCQNLKANYRRSVIHYGSAPSPVSHTERHLQAVEWLALFLFLISQSQARLHMWAAQHWASPLWSHKKVQWREWTIRAKIPP